MIVTSQADVELKEKIAAVSEVLSRMEGVFPNCKLTLVIRHKESYETSLLFSKDDPREVINAVRYLGKAMEIKDK